MSNKFNLTADVLVAFEDNECNRYVLLTKNKNKWSILGTSLKDNETFIEAAKREISKRIDLDIKDSLFSFLNVYDDPKRNIKNRTISGVYFHFIEDLELVSKIKAKDNVKWFRVNNLPDLVFDHKKIIEDFIKQQYI